MKYVVYVIKSAKWYLYTGTTEDLQGRLDQHNTHSLSFWTTRGTEWRRVYSEEFENKSEASRREEGQKCGVTWEYLKQVLEQR